MASGPPQQQPPYGLAAAQPAFDRVTRVAKALFGAQDASVVLLDGSRAWRSRDRFGMFQDADSATDTVRQTGEPLWVADAREDPRFRDDPTVTGPLQIRFFAGAPVQL